jgi:hypothetical protein
MAVLVAVGSLSTLALVIAVPSLRELFRFAPPPAAWLIAGMIAAIISVWWIDLLRGAPVAVDAGAHARTPVARAGHPR